MGVFFFGKEMDEIHLKKKVKYNTSWENNPPTQNKTLLRF
jgi:hypothetical protein